MNAALCEQVGAGAFPSPSQILSAGASSLQACGLGYRVKTLLRVAEQVWTSFWQPVKQQSVHWCTALTKGMDCSVLMIIWQSWSLWLTAAMIRTCIKRFSS